MPKIKVDIIGEDGIKSSKNYSIEENRVIIKSGRGRALTWKPKFTKNCELLYYTGFWPFKELKKKLMVLEGAKKCIQFYGKDGIQLNSLTPKVLEEYSRATVIKRAGETTQKVHVPMFLYVLVGITTIFSVINLIFSFMGSRYQFG